MKRVAIYARFSMDRQNRLSIEDQLDQCEAYTDLKGWQVVARVEDQAISGTVTQTRPGVLRLIELVKGRRIDFIVCTSQDRLTRDPELNEKLLKMLPFYGVEAHYTQSGGTISPIEQRLRSLLSAEQIKDIGVKTWQGQKGHFQRGKAVAGLAYGYEIFVEHDSKGDRVKGLRRINEDQAEVVRSIFKDYSLGYSPRDIAAALNAKKISGPSGLLWRDTTIRGHAKRGTGILNNEMYIGRRVWNRQRYIRNPETDRRNSRINPEQQQLTVEVPELRIVAQNLWDLVKVQQSIRTTIFKEGSANYLTGNKRPEYLFSGILRCAICEGPYAIMGKDRYGCTNHRKRLGCDNARTVMRREVEQRVNTAIPDALLTSASLDNIRVRAVELISQSRKQSHKNENDLRRSLSKAQAEINNLIDAIRSGIRSDSVQKALAEAEEQEKAAKKALEDFNTDPAVGALPPLNAGILQIAVRAMSAAGQANPESREAKEWMQLVRSMIDKIVIHPLEPKGVSLEIHGRGAVLLAAMEAWNGEEARIKREYHAKFVKLRQEGRFTSVEDRIHFIEEMNRELEKRKRPFERFQLTVVAGAGFEPATFRL